MEADDRQVTTVFTVRHSTIGTRQTEYHDALPSSANDEVRCVCTFADDGNTLWYSVCQCRWWIDGWTVKTVVTWRSSASMIPAPGLLRFASDQNRLVGLVVKASASRAKDPGFESRLRRDFFGVESYQWLKNWHSSGYPARRLALEGQRWDWSARCQYTVTGWGRKSDLQLLSQCGNT